MVQGRAGFPGPGTCPGQCHHPWSGLCREGRAGIWVGEGAGNIHPRTWFSPTAPSLAAAGFPTLASWHGGGGSSALMLLLGYLGTPNLVSRLVEDTFSHQVLLWSPQIPPLASQTPLFPAVPGRWSLTGPWELPLFSRRCREKKSLVSFYFSEGETERAAKVEAFPREL